MTLIGALIGGIIVGLIPFFLGKKRNNEGIGTAGLIACVVCNLLLGLLLSIPCCIVFVILILVKARGKGR